MNDGNIIIDMCDQGHKFAKLPGHPMRDGIPRCPNCMSVGLDSARQELELIRKFVESCAKTAGLNIDGNALSLKAQELLI